MTTIRNIIRRAYLSAEGERGYPTAENAELALIRLQDVLNALVLDRTGSNGWTDVYTTGLTTYEADDGERVYAASTCTVTLPTTTTDEDGDTVAMADLSRVHIIGTAANAGLWVYAASKGAWSQVDGLEVSDESPFGLEDDAGLAALLAVALVGDGGGEVSPVVVAQAQEQERSFRARMRREVIVGLDDAYLNLSEMGHPNIETSSTAA